MPKSKPQSRPKRKADSGKDADPAPSPTSPSSKQPPSLSNPYSYHIGRGETGVLTVEPYKSVLLPLWRFRTPAIATRSAADLWARFLEYEERNDFVGMDMARKFIQMGMTRAARYANYKGGRKYAKEGGEGQTQEKETLNLKGGRQAGRKALRKSEGHEGKEDKEEASLIFRRAWERCRAHEGYQSKKAEFMKGQKEWEREKKKVKVGD